MKTYTFTEDAIATTIDYSNGERNTINLEDCELLPPNGKWLTREEVENVIAKVYLDWGMEKNQILVKVIGKDLADELFGDEP